MHLVTIRVIAAVSALLACVSAQIKPLPPQKPAPKTEGQGLLEQLRRNPPKYLEGPQVVYCVQPEDTIFPALVIAGATMLQEPQAKSEFVLGDGRMIAIGLVAPMDQTLIKVAISCDDLMEPSSFQGVLGKKGETYVVMPKIKWKYRLLMQNRQQVPVDVTFKVKIGNFPETEHVHTCTLRSLNDCPLRFVAGNELFDTHVAFAAYVNEDHPWVDGILRDALETRVVQNFTGYQLNDPDIVLQQVYALWRVFQTRGISYSDISRVSAARPGVISSQHVRFLDECITNKQANCIDGTVMFASVLRKVGINPLIVLVPGHAFLAFGIDRQGTVLYGLETTVIGSARKEDFDRAEKLRTQLIASKTFDQASWDSFQTALKVGNDRLAREMPRLHSSKPEDSEYWLIDIDAARDVGVRPIPYVQDGAAVGEPKPRKLERIR